MDFLNAEVTVLRRLGVGVLCASLIGGAASIGLAVLFFRYSDASMSRLLFTPLIGIIFSTALLTIAGAIQKRWSVLVMQLNLAFVTVAAIGWLSAIWSSGIQEWMYAMILYRILGSLSVAGGTILVVVYTLHTRTEMIALTIGRWIGAAWMTMYASAGIALMWWTWNEKYMDIIGMSVSVGALVTFVGLMALAMLIRASKKPKAPARESLPTQFKLRLTCPRCKHDQVLGMGLRRCAKCGQSLLIEVEEPRCDCGYLLYQLQTNVCPECGRKVEVKHVAAGAPIPSSTTTN